MMEANQPEFDFDGEPEVDPEPPRSAKGTASAPILERIKKLLRLAADQRGNPHEAERAAAMAFDLAERHHVDVASLNLGEEVEQLIGDHFHYGNRIDFINQRAGEIVATYFHVEPCICHPKILFVGRETDVQIAGYVYEFLGRAARDCRNAWETAEKARRRKMTTLKRKNYIIGFFWAISENLSKQRGALQLDDAKNALVLAEEMKRKAKLDEMVPDRVNIKTREVRKNFTAIGAGWDDGKRTQINQPLNGGRKEVLALPA